MIEALLHSYLNKRVDNNEVLPHLHLHKQQMLVLEKRTIVNPYLLVMTNFIQGILFVVLRENFHRTYFSYFQSTSFGVGIGLPGEAITTHSQAVGTSTIWWGLYSIQLGPAFLLK
jgi:hypothetical protein